MKSACSSSVCEIWIIQADVKQLRSRLHSPKDMRTLWGIRETFAWDTYLSPPWTLWDAGCMRRYLAPGSKSLTQNSCGDWVSDGGDLDTNSTCFLTCWFPRKYDPGLCSPDLTRGHQYCFAWSFENTAACQFHLNSTFPQILHQCHLFFPGFIRFHVCLCPRLGKDQGRSLVTLPPSHCNVMVRFFNF